MNEFILIGNKNQTKQFCKLLIEMEVPCCLFITNSDGENVDFYDTRGGRFYIYSNGICNGSLLRKKCVGMISSKQDEFLEGGYDTYYMNNEKDYNYVLIKILELTNNKNYVRVNRDNQLQDLGI